MQIQTQSAWLLSKYIRRILAVEDAKCPALLKILHFTPPSRLALGPILNRIRRPAEPCSWAAPCPLALWIRPLLDHKPQPSLPDLPPASHVVNQSVISMDSSSLVFCALLIICSPSSRYCSLCETLLAVLSALIRQTSTVTLAPLCYCH